MIFAGMLIGRHDVVQDRPDSREVRLAAVEEHLRRLGVAQDRRQRLVQFVGQRPDSSPSIVTPRQVRQVVALLFDLKFCLLALGDVIVAPNILNGFLSASRYIRPRATTQRKPPSGNTTRYSSE